MGRKAKKASAGKEEAKTRTESDTECQEAQGVGPSDEGSPAGSAVDDPEIERLARKTVERDAQKVKPQRLALPTAYDLPSAYSGGGRVLDRDRKINLQFLREIILAFLARLEAVTLPGDQVRRVFSEGGALSLTAAGSHLTDQFFTAYGRLGEGYFDEEWCLPELSEIIAKLPREWCDDYVQIHEAIDCVGAAMRWPSDEWNAGPQFRSGDLYPLEKVNLLRSAAQLLEVVMAARQRAGARPPGEQQALPSGAPTRADWDALTASERRILKADAGAVEPPSPAIDPWRDACTGENLIGWADILAALDWKVTDRQRKQVKRLNDNRGGPIVRQQRKPVVDKGALLAWWESLARVGGAIDQRDRSRGFLEDVHHASDEGMHHERRPNARGKAR